MQALELMDRLLRSLQLPILLIQILLVIKVFISHLILKLFNKLSYNLSNLCKNMREGKKTLYN